MKNSIFIDQLKGQGQNKKSVKLSKHLIRKMEYIFGHDFSNILIHEGTEVSMMCAKAFTYGDNIYFAEGMYNPETRSGLELLVHELAHVVQQREGRTNHCKSTYGIVHDQLLEKEADEKAAQVVETIFINKLFLKKKVCREISIIKPVIQCKFPDYDSVEDVMGEMKSIESDVQYDFTVDNPETKEYISYLFGSNKSYDIDDLMYLCNDDLIKFQNLKKAVRHLEINYRRKKAIQSTLIFDQVMGQHYTKLRGEQLREIDYDLWLSYEYGLQTTRNLTVAPTGLRLYNKYSAVYLRDDPDFERLQRENRVLTKLSIKKMESDSLYSDFCNADEHSYYFVNSKLIEKKIKYYNSNWVPHSFYQLSHGIYHMKVHNLNTNFNMGYNRTYTLEKLLKHLGANPSSFQAIKELHTIHFADQDGEINNYAILTNLLNCNAYNTINKLAGDDSTPHVIVFRLILELLSGLLYFENPTYKNDIDKFNKFKTSKVIQSALLKIINILDLISVSANHDTNFTRYFELFINELHLIVIVTQLYDKESVTKLIKNVYLDRIPKLKSDKASLKAHISLDSSGMGALSTAVIAVLSDYNNACLIKRISIHKDYYEFKDILHDRNIANQNSNLENIGIFTATINPSTPYRGNTTIQSIIDAIITRAENTAFQFITLIIDITIEIDGGENDSQLNKLVLGLADLIKAGKVNLIFAKSFQKYASFGCSKIMSGMVMAINNGDDKFAKSNSFIQDIHDEEFIQFDENQLLCYFLQNAADFELKLIQKASDNANFLHNYWKNNNSMQGFPENLMQFQPGLPFIMEKPLFFSDPKYQYHLNTQFFLQDLGLERRDSFSFMNSSFLIIKKNFGRFTIGQESESRLLEKFYALMVVPKSNRIPTLQLVATVNHDFIKNAIQSFVNTTDKIDNKIASLLHMAYVLLIDNLLNELHQLYKDYFPDSNAPITDEMRSQLIINWMKIFIKLPINTINTEQTTWTLLTDVPAYQLAKFFINDVPNNKFSQLNASIKTKLTEQTLQRLDLDSLIYVWTEIIKKGELEKAKVVYQLVDEHFYMYEFTSDVHSTLEDEEHLKMIPEGTCELLKELENCTYMLRYFCRADILSKTRGQIELTENQIGVILQKARFEKGEYWLGSTALRTLQNVYEFPKEIINKLKVTIYEKNILDVPDFKEKLKKENLGIALSDLQKFQIIGCSKQKVIKDRGLLVDDILGTAYMTTLRQYDDILYQMRTVMGEFVIDEAEQRGEQFQQFIAQQKMLRTQIHNAEICYEEFREGLEVV